MRVVKGTHQQGLTMHWQKWATHALSSGAPHLLCVSGCVSVQADPSPSLGIPEVLSGSTKMLILVTYSAPSYRPCKSDLGSSVGSGYCVHVGKDEVGW